MIHSHDHFFVYPQDVGEHTLKIKGSEFRHAVKIMRKNAGSNFAAVDGCGNCYECQVIKISDSFLQARILKRYEKYGEPNFNLALAVGLLKSSRFEWIVEKGTEIGVGQFIPVICERSVAISENKVNRWQRIALTAMKQCGRSMLPKVHEVVTFVKVIELFSRCSLRLIASETDSAKDTAIAVLNLRNKHEQGILLIGPEGGFSDKETLKALNCGFIPIELGKRRLRSETAAIIAATQILTQCGELGGIQP